ncbi:hypothetical protein KP509_31G044300 [Ceratopteris richardii]|uniref:Uncharacterized protein n=1 Tax=Ceratopteris richardii TaxID=49495 RepID=A0A8T2QY71_CERRI|nr:hypothetical protein KP509_31G044300 [Ceratopteris richardii]
MRKVNCHKKSSSRAGFNCDDCKPTSIVREGQDLRQRAVRSLVEKADRSATHVSGIKRKASWINACAMAYEFVHGSQPACSITRPPRPYAVGDAELRAKNLTQSANLSIGAIRDGCERAIRHPEGNDMHDSSSVPLSKKSCSRGGGYSDEPNLSIQDIVNPSQAREWLTHRALSPLALLS